MLYLLVSELFVNKGRRYVVLIREITEIADLSTAEKILLVEDLWDSIIPDEGSIPVPQSHKEELDMRFMKYQANPGNLLTLDELQNRIAKRK